MHWIDIELPITGRCPETDRFLDTARTLFDQIGALQDHRGLDAPVVTARLELVGRALFDAVTAHQPDAFRPDADRPGMVTPGKNGPLGYHLLAADDQLGLPWHALHNGVTFLLDKTPIVAACHGSRPPEVDPPRIWMQRQSDALFPDHDTTTTKERACPEVLFVPGHGKEEIRRLMFREADGIDIALSGAVEPPARLRIPGSITPGLLAARAMLYQVLHFAAPTSQPPEVSQAGEQQWLAGLMAAAGQPDSSEIDELVGLDTEILGVDPVDAALDHALEAYARHGQSAHRHADRTATVTAPEGWLLDDGPVTPEHFGRDGCLPPLIFSNSWCSLDWLGQRFLNAGASTFVGTSIPVYSRPARLFAAIFYGALRDGACVGSAHREASLALRTRLGREHPAWLAYGVQGFGTLRLADL